MIEDLKQSYNELSDPNSAKFEIYKRNFLVIPTMGFIIIMGLVFMISKFNEVSAEPTQIKQKGMNTTMPTANVEEVADTKDKAIEITTKRTFQLPSDTGINLAQLEVADKDTAPDYNSAANQNIESALASFKTPETLNRSQFKAEDDKMRQYQKEAKENIEEQTIPSTVEPYTTKQDQDTIKDKRSSKSVFHSLSLNNQSNSKNESKKNSTIKNIQVDVPAAILKKVKVKNGQTVAIRILKTTTIQDVVIKRNTILRGIVSIGQSRVQITIPGGNIDGKLSNARFSVFDNAGIEGLEVAGLEKLAAGREVKDEALSTNIPTDNFGILSGVTNVVRALGSRRAPVVFLPDGKIILKYIGK